MRLRRAVKNCNLCTVILTLFVQIRDYMSLSVCLYVCMYACVYVSVETYEQQYWQTVGTLPLLNQINEIHTNELNSIKISSPHITFPELHNEVFPK